MAKGYYRKHRFEVFYGESSEYAATEKQAVKLAKANGGYAVECDGDRLVYPLRATSADIYRMWKRLWGNLTPEQVAHYSDMTDGEQYDQTQLTDAEIE